MSTQSIIPRLKTNAFWQGKRLGPIHCACLRSFLRQGHPVALHVYDEPEDVPHGVELVDASRLMDRALAIPYKISGSYAFASNLYRYRLLEAGIGAYIDCDVFCLRPLPDSPYLLGWEDNTTICNAVLAAPADSELIAHLSRYANDPAFIPPWMSNSKKTRLKLLRFLGRPKHPSTMIWGTTGPALLTHCVQELGLEKHALPMDAFYPLHHRQTNMLLEPGLKLADICSPRSYTVHLYNKTLKTDSAPAGSPLREIIDS